MKLNSTKLIRAHFVCILLVVLSAVVLAQDDDDVAITVDSSLVVVNAAVQDSHGRHVSGLREKQFKLFDNGIEQEISLFQSEETPFAAVILLDTSGSMEERVTLARSAAIVFLDGLRKSDVASIYRFDSKVVQVQDFSNVRDVNDRIFDIKADGMTALNDAIFKAAADLANRPEKRRAIVVLSDGADTISKRSFSKALNAASAANAVIYTVDMAPSSTKTNDRVASQNALRSFASKTGGQFITTPGGAALRDAFKDIVEELGVQYTIGYQPSNLIKKDGKWHDIEVRISRPNLIIRTRKGYTAN